MNNLLQLRKKHGYTQEHVAKQLNVTRSMYARYESGMHPLPYEGVRILANLYHVSAEELMGDKKEKKSKTHIPVLGSVRAGIPIDANKDIVDWEDIPEAMARGGEYFGVRVSGDSMEPVLRDGDIVIVRVQPDVESGETAIVTIGGDDATIKKIIKANVGIILKPNNPDYDPMFFSNEDIMTLPVRVVGKAIEIRRKL